jgi:eukaryotic-like serine/threonine-protein kinase
MSSGARGARPLDGKDPEDVPRLSKTEVDDRPTFSDEDIAPRSGTPPRVVGQYELHDVLGSGGMATVHFGRKRGPAGFTRLVAIKRLLPLLAQDEEFVAMFLDEARLAARISHPNVVQTLDVQIADGEFLLALEYVHGEPLYVLEAILRKRGERPDLAVVARIGIDMLEGLHAAHEATGEGGAYLGIVHRDVSPHNVMVGADGMTRVLDFGIAKASERAHTTQEGKIKGKIRYMSPEQLSGEPVDLRTDVYAAGVVLWELVTCARFLESSEGSLMGAVLSKVPARPSLVAGEAVAAMDSVLTRALEKDRKLRFPTAHEMAEAIERAVPPASHVQVGAFVRELASESLAARDHKRRRVQAAVLETVNPAPVKIPEPAGSGEPRASQVPTRTLGRPPLVAAAPTASTAIEQRGRRLWIPASVVVGALLALGGSVWLAKGRSTTPVPTSSLASATAANATQPTPSTTPSLAHAPVAPTDEPSPAPSSASDGAPGVEPAPPHRSGAGHRNAPASSPRSPYRTSGSSGASTAPSSTIPLNPSASASAPPLAPSSQVLDKNGLMPEGR